MMKRMLLKICLTVREIAVAIYDLVLPPPNRPDD